MTIEDVEEWIYHQLDDTTHLLHGVIHANGFGHLLRVNGRESGSRLLSGRHIMNFWDRLCKILGARLINVPEFIISSEVYIVVKNENILQLVMTE